MRLYFFVCCLVCSCFAETIGPLFSSGAYNEPASYELSPNPWLFWFDASFIYWNASQEGLDLAISSAESNGDFVAPKNGKVLFQNTEYTPGFKVGLGVDLDSDHWSALVEYTWLRYHTNTAQNTQSTTWVLSNWFNGQASASSLSSKWRLNMDILDAGLTRPFYRGTHLTFAPFAGVRAEWIRQTLSLNANITSTPGISNSANRSKSWGLGPHLGLKSQWHLGYGFRFEGDLAGSVLLTRYLKVTNDQTPTTNSSYFKHYNSLRGDAQLNVGIGWGSYFDCRNDHIDILVSYDFQIFWNQNMMRQLADASSERTGHSPSNLYLQGVTVRTQFDF